jgi:hypothetical protein
MPGSPLRGQRVPVLLDLVLFAITDTPHAFSDIKSTGQIRRSRQTLPEVSDTRARICSGRVLNHTLPLKERSGTCVCVVIDKGHPKARLANDDLTQVAEGNYIAQIVPPRPLCGVTLGQRTKIRGRSSFRCNWV